MRVETVCPLRPGMIMEQDHSRQREGDGTVQYDGWLTNFLVERRIAAMLRSNKLNNSESNDTKQVAAVKLPVGRIEQFQSEFG